ncbi:kinase-like domain-containing protein [Pavlovales sp. CCMP2436]|nr:kinase-like domain-containing protein [Pavlovales sp. CCMP2436]|mmetsp:Transcript_404/g.1141  ORF Transcript_404/g.1141 Transcript_404/m.1141 type:complete len:355 (-) Transcript_404:283-1347(-)
MIRKDSLGKPDEGASNERHARPSANVFIESSYTLGEQLGRGAFGVVYAATAKQDGAKVAIKVVHKELPSSSVDASELAAQVEQVRNEIRALEDLHEDDGCDAIIGFRGSFETKEKLCIVMDRAHGELAEVIARGKVTVTETSAQQILKRVLEGVAFMHENDYVHRDLKFENLLMMRKDDLSSIVLSDFGLATKTNEAASGECGTPLYMSPEIWTRNSLTHGPKVDIWAVGIIAYILLCGRHPVKAKSVEELKAKVCVDRIQLDFEGTGVSTGAQDFVRRLLTSDSISRPAAKDALAHPFMTGEQTSDVQESVVDMMRAFAAEQRLKKGFLMVRMVTRISIAGRQKSSGSIGSSS